MHSLPRRSFSARFLLFAIGCLPLSLSGQPPNVHQIIEKSVQANKADFKAANDYNWKERSRTPKGTKTFQVSMLQGTPYYRLLEVNGEPLSAAAEREERQKLQQATAKRRSESSTERQRRIQKFEKERQRDEQMMAQLTKAFRFTLVGEEKLKGF